MADIRDRSVQVRLLEQVSCHYSTHGSVGPWPLHLPVFSDFLLHRRGHEVSNIHCNWCGLERGFPAGVDCRSVQLTDLLFSTPGPVVLFDLDDPPFLYLTSSAVIYVISHGACVQYAVIFFFSLPFYLLPFFSLKTWPQLSRLMSMSCLSRGISVWFTAFHLSLIADPLLYAMSYALRLLRDDSDG